MSDLVKPIPVINSLLVEARIKRAPAQGDKYWFQLNDTIVQAHIYGVEVVSNEVLDVSPQGYDVMSPTGLQSIIVNVVEQGTTKEFIQEMPATRLIPSSYNGVTQYLKPRKIDLTKTYFKLTGTNGLSQDEVLLLQLYYTLGDRSELW